ncbi:MAG: deoxyribonuclease IV [Paenibacillaceae bacterium]|nr:deoxyribonuclease IV [Paenibacillaceae bacterium]
MRYIGSHVSFGNQGLIGAVQEACSYGSSTFMVYTGAPQNTTRKPIEQQHVVVARKMMDDAHMAHAIVHAPYIVNLASHKDSVWQLAVSFLQEEVRRTQALGCDTIVLHPGAYTETDVESGIARIAQRLHIVLAETEHVSIALETMAGKGTEIGRSFEEIARIMELVPDPQRLSVCLDTCHVHDAGYDIVHDWDGVLAQLDQTIGCDRLAVVHLNDSKNPRGAKKDRHAPLGSGYIGFAALARIASDQRLQHIPMILETPWIGSDKTFPMYRVEIAMLMNETAQRMGTQFMDDVQRIDDVLCRAGYTPASIVGMWDARAHAKARKADPREPLEQLYDIVAASGVGERWTERDGYERLVCWLASGADRGQSAIGL